MIYQATRAIYDVLKNDEDLKVFIDEHDKASEAWLGFRVDNGPSYRIHFINNDNDNDTAVRVFALLNVDPEHKQKLLPVINDLNCRYRFVKIVCDSDGDVHLEYDYPVKCSSPAESCGEIVARFVKIIDDIYPDLMRAMWS